MARLLLIYSLIILVSRVLRGFRESRQAAPKRREPVPFPPTKDGGDTYRPEEQRTTGDVPTFPTAAKIRPRKDLVPPRKAEPVEVISRIPPRKEKLKPAQRGKQAIKGLFSGPEAYVRGIIMSEVLQPPRSKRPWRPHI
ncbi:MAG: hypothetical protein GX376_05970 [Firmicutes bacterium]|nr:hypothetical protein [Bacillota bacterium]